MKCLTSHGIGYFVEKMKSNNILFNEFVSNADSYFHYSNQILFEISGNSGAMFLLFLIVDSTGTVTEFLLIFLFKPAYLFYHEFKDNAKIFDGVIDRYCGVPP